VCEGLRRLVSERERERSRVIREAANLASSLRELLGKVTVLLYGSYSRGDFNLWSDIDVLIISEGFKDLNPLERLDLIQRVLPPRFEAKCLTPSEAEEAFKKAWWAKVLKEAIVVADDYGILPQNSSRPSTS